MKITRRKFISNLAITTGVLAGTHCTSSLLQAAIKKKDKPNIVFIFADDLGWGDLGCYGHPHIKTPNIDRLARQGTLFTQFYVCGSVCSPSRAAVISGQFPSRNKVFGHFAPGRNSKRGMPNALNTDIFTLPKSLKNAGYVTGHFGKWHLGIEDLSKYGFDYGKSSNGGGSHGYDISNGFQKLKNISSELFVDDTIDFIEKHKDKPFYVQTWFLDPHASLDPTEKMIEPYNYLADPRVGEKYKGAKRIYYSVVTNLDKHIGRLLDKLDKLGLSENTIVIFSSDNGPEDIHINNASHSGIGSPGPFRGRKRSLYEGGTRVPFIVRWPGKCPEGKIDNKSLLASVDLLPTFSNIAGAQLPQNYKPDGQNITEAFKGKPFNRDKAIMWDYRYPVAGYVFHHSPWLAIRQENWKLLMNPDKSRVELYNIPDDPSEMNDLSKVFPQVTERLSKKLLSWYKELPEGPVSSSAGKANYPWPK